MNKYTFRYTDTSGTQRRAFSVEAESLHWACQEAATLGPMQQAAASLYGRNDVTHQYNPTSRIMAMVNGLEACTITETPLRRKTPPNPGSRAAVALGCTCPVMDNSNGAGFSSKGRTCFWIDGGCPVHTAKGTKDED